MWLLPGKRSDVFECYVWGYLKDISSLEGIFLLPKFEPVKFLSRSCKVHEVHCFMLPSYGYRFQLWTLAGHRRRVKLRIRKEQGEYLSLVRAEVHASLAKSTLLLYTCIMKVLLCSCLVLALEQFAEQQYINY